MEYSTIDDPFLHFAPANLETPAADVPVEQTETAATEPPDQAVQNACTAMNLRDASAAGWLYWAVNSLYPELVSIDAFQLFRQALLRDAGNPSDPIEVMMIEQLALAHFGIGRLQVRSCSADNAKWTIAYADSTTRLLGEFRRCTLALEQYRTSQENRNKEKAAKNAIAATATEPSENNGKPRSAANGKKPNDSELTSNGEREIPEWLQKRMAYPGPTQDESQLVAATNGNGRA